MPHTYAYLGAWNDWLNKPLLDEGWIEEDEARARYEGLRDHFEVGPTPSSRASRMNRDSSPPGRCASTRRGTPASVRPSSTSAGPVRRVVWYELVDGRLFRSEVTEYAYDYAQEHGRRDEDECVLLTIGRFEPDGTGTLWIEDKSVPTSRRLSIDQIDVSGQWLDVPAFGDWSRLSDPRFRELVDVGSGRASTRGPSPLDPHAPTADQGRPRHAHVSPRLLVCARPLACALAWHIVRLRSNRCEHLSRALHTLASP